MNGEHSAASPGPDPSTCRFHFGTALHGGDGGRDQVLCERPVRRSSVAGMGGRRWCFIRQAEEIHAGQLQPARCHAYNARRRAVSSVG